MPFKEITSGKDKGKYRSPSGRVMTLAQVQAYYSKQPKNHARHESLRRMK